MGPLDIQASYMFSIIPNMKAWEEKAPLQLFLANWEATTRNKFQYKLEYAPPISEGDAAIKLPLAIHKFANQAYPFCWRRWYLFASDSSIRKVKDLSAAIVAQAPVHDGGGFEAQSREIHRSDI